MALANGEWLQNRYRIISSLGAGGMGAIYQAQDTRLDVLVALKEMMPLPNLNPDTLTQLREQFQQEAKILARLKHPHLVRVSDYFVERGNAYLVMDFIKGHNLAAHIRHRGPLPEEQVVTWGGQLLDALAYCHARGIIHRDVKPQNVIIQSNGDAILVDFGLVKLWDPNDPRTKTAMHGMGTPEYAPPEQYGAKQEHCDARSDIYSLGATLYHALAGKAPPTATERIVDPESFKPLQVITPDVSKRTAQTVMKALELTPTQRWQRAEEMTEALCAPISKSKEDVQDIDRPKETYPLFQRLPKLLVWLKQNNFLAQPMRKVALGIGSVAVFTFVISLVVGIIPPHPDPTRPPTSTEITISPTPSPSPYPSATPSPSLAPTNSPTPPAPKPTKTTAPTATATPTQTPSPTPQPPTATPRPLILTSPPEGRTHPNPITFQWEGTLGAGQSYQVTAYHESGHTLRSDPLTAQNWTVDLPGDKFGEWHWDVSVIQGGSIIATSSKGRFYFGLGFVPVPPTEEPDTTPTRVTPTRPSD